MPLLKSIAARMPERIQLELKRMWFSRQIAKNTFVADEPEFDLLPDLVKPGDWVIDVGANVGHYTKRLSDLVGQTGRVIAFEPIPTSFTLLASNVQLFKYPNVSLINSAISDKIGTAGMSIPNFSSGLTNYYQAHISAANESELSVLTLPLDCLNITNKISLIKIDAEGHEEFVLSGMKSTIEKHHPTLIIETGSADIISSLESSGYRANKLDNSPNYLFKYS